MYPLLLALSLFTQAAPTARVVRLDDAVETALRHQPAVLQAQATTRAAEGRSTQARAGLLPQVNASATVQRIHGNRSATTTTAPGAAGGVAAPATAPTASTYDYFSAGVSASQLLWDFGQNYGRWRAAETQVAAQRASERTAEQQVLFGVRRAFFQARASRSLVLVATETLANQERHARQIEGFVTVGTRPDIDLVQARTDTANARVALINARASYDVAKAQLNQAMGTVGDVDYDVGDEDLAAIDGEDLPAAALVDRALAARPELVALDRQREALERTARALKGGYGPTLSAVGGASESGPSLDSLAPSWNIGATLAWPIFQGGLTTGQVREAQANLDVTRAEADAERLQIRFDVAQAQLNVRGAKATIEAAGDALANARERLRLAEARYASGVGSAIELGDAQLALTSAAAQSVQASFNLSTARAQLLASLGRR
jgi:outer membrane protein